MWQCTPQCGYYRLNIFISTIFDGILIHVFYHMRKNMDISKYLLTSSVHHRILVISTIQRLSLSGWNKKAGVLLENLRLDISITYNKSKLIAKKAKARKILSFDAQKLSPDISLQKRRSKYFLCARKTARQTASLISLSM